MPKKKINIGFGEGERHQIILPVDEPDEEDEREAFVERAIRRRKGHIQRGTGMRGT